MCGSGNLSGIEAQQAQTASALKSDFNTEFAGNQNILSSIAPALESITAAGVGQAGYTAPENAALQSNILATNAAATRQASNVAGEQLSAIGGGNQVLPSGSKAAIMGNIAEQGAQTGASELQQETAQNYATGRSNFFGATQELPQATSTLENATNAIGGLANQAESGQAQTEQDRLNATRAWIAPVEGLATAGLSAASKTKSFQNI